jgi:uncharacterized protein YqjF (DUF2071 family)
VKSGVLESARDASPSGDARGRLLANPGEPLFYSDWLRAVFMHYEVDVEHLQRAVPFELDLREGKAYVSAVAFTMRGLRPACGGRWTAWLLAPIATHGLLNVRTYVRHSGEAGIYFLAEWIPNRLSVLLGPRTFGLPYRFGQLDYEHVHEAGKLQGRVTAASSELSYAADIAINRDFKPCPAGSLSEFLLERYTAFTTCGSRGKFFRIWHEPWLQKCTEVRIWDDSLLAVHFPWFRDAKLTAANYAPGVDRVWMGRPHRVP